MTFLLIAFSIILSFQFYYGFCVGVGDVVGDVLGVGDVVGDALGVGVTSFNLLTVIFIVSPASAFSVLFCFNTIPSSSGWKWWIYI